MTFFQEAIKTLTALVDALCGKQLWQANLTIYRHVKSACHGKRPHTKRFYPHQNANWYYTRPG